MLANIMKLGTARHRSNGYTREFKAAMALWTCLILMTPQTASAYIDPGAGSFMVQAMLAMLAGIVVTGRLYWAKIKSMLGLGSSSSDDDDDQDDDD